MLRANSTLRDVRVGVDELKDELPSAVREAVGQSMVDLGTDVEAVLSESLQARRDDTIANLRKLLDAAVDGAASGDDARAAIQAAQALEKMLVIFTVNLFGGSTNGKNKGQS